MNLIVCLDLKNGMRFNNRRQSRDAAVIDRICAITSGSELFVDEYSQKLFTLLCSDLNIHSNPSEIPNKGDYCFIEQCKHVPDERNIEKIIVYRWDKIYPHDEVFTIDLKKWKLAFKQEFKGNSHDKITQEVYVK